ncbi:DUF4349 domain-containing protein [Paenibacillus beijingensis]|uniref:DUF4349 domain-containing protein n=1 Tax=Paenibacillus beijingensis TaxID=1126833 RepID=UPI0006989A80|nr:DUF4349 domain-containing protein [Paenibacillus beijingensis]
MRRRGVRWITAAAVLLLIALTLLAGCSAENSGSADTAGSSAAVTSSADKDMFQAASPAEEGKAESASSPEAPALSDQASTGTVPAGNKASSQQETSTSETETEGDVAFDRKIVYKATLTMEVKDFAKASVALQNVLHQSGGYILKFSDSKNSAENGAAYTLKVPADGFMSFLTRLEQIEHSLFERQMTGTDVTEEYVDLTARLKAKQVVEARLLSFMDKAQSASDLLEFSSQLASVQGDIERIKGRMRYLDTNVAYSTIELRMYQPVTAAPVVPDGPKALGVRMSDALTASTKGISAIFQGVLVFAAGALPVLILLLIGLALLWLFRRTFRGRPLHTLKPGTGLADPAPPSSIADESPDADRKPKS